MRDLEKFLEELKIPEVEAKTHRKLLKKHLLNNFESSKKSNFLKGGESFMYIKSKGIFGKFAIGALVLLLAVAVATGFNPLNLQKANAQDIVKKALNKVSQLPQSEQEKLENEKETLEKAQKAKDLRVHSSSTTQTGAKVTVLKFTDDEGEEETIEIDEDDLPIDSDHPSTTPSPSPSGTTVTPSAGAGSGTSVSPSPTSSTRKSIRGGEREDDDREDVKGVNIQSSTQVKSDDSKTSVSTQNSISGEREDETEKKD